MKYIAEPEFVGTLERRIALILDHHFIYVAPGHEKLIGLPRGMEELVEVLAKAVREPLPVVPKVKPAPMTFEELVALTEAAVG